MSGLPWFKCDPVAFNNGMVGLSAAERGAYVTVVFAIYAEGGPVRDDAEYFATLLRISDDDWEKIKQRLVAKTKLNIISIDGSNYLMNPRAESEIIAYETTIRTARKAGQASARARGQRSRKHLKEIEK